nr:hypothetical protein B0A51_04169 [Rachicladosporium sp. CCFEE 5018]
MERQTRSLSFKNPPWRQVKERIITTLARTPTNGNAQTQTDRLTKAVESAVEELVLKARPSPYAKSDDDDDLRAK